MEKEDLDKLVKIIRLAREITVNYTMIQALERDGKDKVIKDKLVAGIIAYHRQMKNIDMD